MNTKANIELPNGTKITIEGESDEIARTVNLINGSMHYAKGDTITVPQSIEKRPHRAGKDGATSRILILIDEGFFKERRVLQDVRQGLEERGHVYPVTSLSPSMIRLVRAGKLRRLRENNKWVYVEV